MRERITTAINAAETDGKNRVERVRAAISAATQQPQDVASQTLYELQVARGYQSIQLQLASGNNLLTIAREAGKRQDKAVIQALRVYAPSLVASQDLDDSMVDAAERAIALSETPFMSQTQLVCRDLTSELEAALAT